MGIFASGGIYSVIIHTFSMSMLQKGFIKPQLTINRLGKKHFWIGIIFGLTIAVLLNFFMNWSRESLRLLTILRDLLILEKRELFLYDLFFSSFSTAFGLGFTIIYWLHYERKIVRKRYMRTYAITYTFLISFLPFIILVRIGSLLPFLIYCMYGYDDQLNFLKEYWLFISLIPLYIFLANWNIVRILYKTRFWIILSFFIWSAVSMSIIRITSADREVLNHAYYLLHKTKFDYIDTELEKAKALGITYDKKTKKYLKSINSEGSTKLVKDVKQAFAKKHVVSIDTLILQKILIHNMNRHERYWIRNYRRFSPDANWSYAYPEEIYCQILMHDVNSFETKILFEILSEQQVILSVKDFSYEESLKLPQSERHLQFDRYYILRNTETIQSRLIQVIEKIKSDETYKQYFYSLPDIEYDESIGPQKYHELNL